ncbi:hypothetical protein M3J09_004421 [Ascochyta lentis]
MRRLTTAEGWKTMMMASKQASKEGNKIHQVASTAYRLKPRDEDLEARTGSRTRSSQSPLASLQASWTRRLQAATLFTAAGAPTTQAWAKFTRPRSSTTAADSTTCFHVSTSRRAMAPPCTAATVKRSEWPNKLLFPACSILLSCAVPGPASRAPFNRIVSLFSSSRHAAAVLVSADETSAFDSSRTASLLVSLSHKAASTPHPQLSLLHCWGVDVRPLISSAIFNINVEGDASHHI